jgi:hypothetical protein
MKLGKLFIIEIINSSKDKYFEKELSRNLRNEEVNKSKYTFENFNNPESIITMAYYSQTSKITNQKRILRTASKKYQVTFMGNPIRVTADFSAETSLSRRE